MEGVGSQLREQAFLLTSAVAWPRRRRAGKSAAEMTRWLIVLSRVWENEVTARRWSESRGTRFFVLPRARHKRVLRGLCAISHNFKLTQ